MTETRRHPEVTYDGPEGGPVFLVGVTTKTDVGGFDGKRQRLIVANPTDVYDWDGYLVVQGCDHTRTVKHEHEEEPRVFEIQGRVTIFPPGEVVRIDVVAANH